MQTPTICSAGGIAVDLDRTVQIASLRYFDAVAFSARLTSLFGCGLPDALGAVRAKFAASGEECIFLWRSPTETWLLSATSMPIAALERELAGAEDCRLIPQTGGILVLHVEGPRTADLMERLGSTASIPRAGETLTGRFADLTVTVFGVQANEVVLLVDRAYADHLRGWIREALADFPT